MAFDLSQVLFIATANKFDTIPGPLRDRMEILMLSGYTDEEKVGIARQYLIPKQLAAHGLATHELSFEPDAIRQIVRSYTREAGVRNLEREIAAVGRKVARRIAEGHREPVRITVETLAEYLGRPRFFDEVAERTTRPGVATGLAWTPTGGDVLFVEVTMMRSSEERVVLTGMLGDVMRESAQAAVPYVWSNAEVLDIDPKPFEGKTIHVHVPARGHPQGWTLGWCDHRDGAGLARDAAAGAERGGHDRRDHSWCRSRGRTQLTSSTEGRSAPSRKTAGDRFVGPRSGASAEDG